MRRPHSLVICIALALTTLGSLSARAQGVLEQIDWAAAGNFLLNPGGAPTEVGNAVLLGFFPVGFDFAANRTFSSLDAAFTEIDATTMGDGGFGAGQFYDEVVVTTAGSEGRQLYIWFFNSPTPVNAAAWGIVTNTTDSDWTVPTNGNNNFPDTSDPGTFVPVGSFGLANGLDWEMELVPEPSTYALMGLGLIGLFVAHCRRKTANI